MSTLVLLPREVCRASCGFDRTWCERPIVKGRRYALGDDFDCGACKRAEKKMRAAAEERHFARAVPERDRPTIAAALRAGVCPCKTEVEDPGPGHLTSCPWSDPEYSEGF